MDFTEAIFLGNTNAYRSYKEYTMPDIWNAEFPIDKDGKILPTKDERGEFIPPQTHPNFKCFAQYSFKPGDVVYIPIYDSTKLTRAVRSQRFVKIEAKDKVKEALDKNQPIGDIWKQMQSQGLLFDYPQGTKPVEADSPAVDAAIKAGEGVANVTVEDTQYQPEGRKGG